MPFHNLAGTIGFSSLPAIALSPAAMTRAEGNGGTTAFTYTLTRSGDTSRAVAVAYAVTGSGANPASASDFAGGVLPSGIVTVPAGQTSAALTVSVAGDTTPESDEGFTVTLTGATLALTIAQATATGTIVNDDASATPILMSSRLNQMGWGGYTGSNGTDTDSNSRIAAFNETGATVTRLRAYFANWYHAAITESAGYNPITVTAAIEYPAGTFTPLLFGGAGAVSIPATGANLAESDEATLATAIPAGAQFWIRSQVVVTSGQKWVQGYLIGTALGEAVDFSTGVAKVTGGTISNYATPDLTHRAYGPVGVKATAFSGTPVTRAYASLGDSIMRADGDAAGDAHGNFQYVGRAMSGRYPYFNTGMSGARARYQPTHLTYRKALYAALGVTDIVMDYGVNDLIDPRSAAQIKADNEAIIAELVAAIPGLRVHPTTITPKTSASSDGYKTVTGQTVLATPAGAFDGGAASQRAIYNGYVRAGLTGAAPYFEAGDAVEFARDDGRWRAGNAPLDNAHLTSTATFSDAATSDGTHPGVTSANGEYGSVFILRDALVAAMAGW